MEWHYTYVAFYAKCLLGGYLEITEILKGKPKKRNAEVLDNAREIVEATPSISLRRLSQ